MTDQPKAGREKPKRGTLDSIFFEPDDDLAGQNDRKKIGGVHPTVDECMAHLGIAKHRMDMVKDQLALLSNVKNSNRQRNEAAQNRTVGTIIDEILIELDHARRQLLAAVGSEQHSSRKLGMPIVVTKKHFTAEVRSEVNQLSDKITNTLKQLNKFARENSTLDVLSKLDIDITERYLRIVRPPQDRNGHALSPRTLIRGLARKL